MHLGYDGSCYSGWQKQTSASHTVQGTIEQALSKVCKRDVSLFGCGRTDTGVHASQYVTQFDLDEPPAYDLKFRLNKNLPDDIAVFEIIEVKQSWNCRNDAISRTYDYFAHWEKDPALAKYSSFYQGLDLNVERMEQVVSLIRHHKDFRALCKQADIYEHTVCEISDCRLFVNREQGRLRFSITGNRFLRGMVRYCVSFLLKVGTGDLSLEEFRQILHQESDLERHAEQKSPALPNGLFLSRVVYPSLEFKNSHQLIRMLKVGLS